MWSSMSSTGGLGGIYVRSMLLGCSWSCVLSFQLVHIFAHEPAHFPPIKALFLLVTSVTLTLFQQGMFSLAPSLILGCHIGNNSSLCGLACRVLISRQGRSSLPQIKLVPRSVPKASTLCIRVLAYERSWWGVPSGVLLPWYQWLSWQLCYSLSLSVPTSPQGISKSCPFLARLFQFRVLKEGRDLMLRVLRGSRNF